MDEESSNSSDEDESNNYKEECVDRLVTLEWCKCENCEIVTLNNPRDCLCCREHQGTSLGQFQQQAYQMRHSA